MQLFETIDRAQRIHRMIQKSATGTPSEFAERLHISRRLLYYLLDELKISEQKLHTTVLNARFIMQITLSWNLLSKSVHSLPKKKVTFMVEILNFLSNVQGGCTEPTYLC